MAENTYARKWQKIHTLKMTEQNCMRQKISENKHIGKWQKIHTLKMTEQKMYNMESGRKYTYWKMTEKTHLENYRTVDAQN